jgi:hypothetical protein
MKDFLLKGMLLFAFCSVVASCAQNEEIEVTPKEVKEVTVTTHFAATTRATIIQENMELFFTVYNSTTGEIVEKSTSNLENLSSNGETSVTLTLQLEQGLSYDIAFWAQPKGLDCYNVSDLKAIKIDYTKCLANNTHRNVFYGNVSNLRTSQKDEVNVTLKNPFGKIEVLTTTEDVEAASTLGLNLDNMKSCMKVKGIATSFNALYGMAEGEKTSVSLLPSSIPTDIQTIKGKTYRLLASEFVLGFPNQAIDVEVELSSENEQESLSFFAGKAWAEHEQTFTLYDRYLTSPIEFDIKIDSEIN